MQNDDAALLRGCRLGDQVAWETLVRRYQRLIYAIPRRAGLNEEQAADVFQRVCVILLEHLDQIDRPERIGAWLATTARRESWQQIRRERGLITRSSGEEQSDLLAEMSDPAPLPDEVFERLERQQAVRRALGSMGERCRTLLTTLFYQPWPPPYAEIATTLGIPEGSVGPTRARCLQKLQRLLEAEDI